MAFRPSGISVFIRQSLVAGSSRSGTTLNIDPIITTDGHRVTMTDIGDIGYAKIDAGNSNEEIISFTGITDNTTTYQLTGVTWGYNFYDNTGDVDANKKKHVSGASFIITNDDHWLTTQFVNADDAQTIAGVKTFSSIPKTTGGDPTDDTELTRKSYVDNAVSGSFPANRVVVAGTAGETVAAGDVVYMDTTDNEWKLADADAAGTSQNVMLGIAQGAGTDGNTISGGVLLEGMDSNQSGMTAGDQMYVSDTAGEIASSAGTVTVTVGIAKSATELYFAPNFAFYVTKDQQDAMAGTSGTPSTSNKFVTADDVKTDGTTDKIVRLDGTSYPAGSGANLTNVTAAKIVVSLTAGENITAGEALIIGGADEESIYAQYLGGSETYEMDDTTWMSQTFNSGMAISIKSVSIKVSAVAHQPTLTVSIQALSGGTPDGTDIESKTATATYPTAGNTAVITATFATAVNISSNTDYAIVLRTNLNGNDTITYSSTNPFSGGQAYRSTDSGSSWAALDGNSDLYFSVKGIRTEAGKVYLSNSTYDDELGNNFIGIADENITADNTGNINIGGVDDNQTGLTTGDTYYLSDTPGAIASSAGSQSRVIGRALSATEIKIINDF